MATHSWPGDDSETETDRDLVRKIKDGDGDAVDRLFRRYYDEVVGYACSLTKDRSSAMDLASEAFLRTWQVIRGGKEVDRPRSYLYAVARNLHIDSLRRNSRLTFDEDIFELAESRSQSHKPDFSETLAERQSLGTAMRTLCPRQREVLWQTVVQGYSTKEVASAQRAATANAGAQLAYRAKRTLREAYVAAN